MNEKLQRVLKRIIKDGISECLHVSLRKACDSPLTTIVWLAFYPMSRKDWAGYLRYVEKGLLGSQVLTDELLTSKPADLCDTIIAKELKRVTLEYFDLQFPYSRDDTYREQKDAIAATRKNCVDNVSRIIEVAFKNFEDYEWEGYASFLSGWIKEEYTKQSDKIKCKAAKQKLGM